jgi:peptide methionine sulfoxide reductase MsrB
MKTKTKKLIWCECHPFCEEAEWHNSCKCFVEPTLKNTKEEKKEESVGKYSIRIECNNCNYGHVFQELIELPKGEAFVDRLRICPWCCCTTLTKKIYGD